MYIVSEMWDSGVANDMNFPHLIRTYLTTKFMFLVAWVSYSSEGTRTFSLGDFLVCDTSRVLFGISEAV